MSNLLAIPATVKLPAKNERALTYRASTASKRSRAFGPKPPLIRWTHRPTRRGRAQVGHGPVSVGVRRGRISGSCTDGHERPAILSRVRGSSAGTVLQNAPKANLDRFGRRGDSWSSTFVSARHLLILVVAIAGACTLYWGTPIDAEGVGYTQNGRPWGTHLGREQ